MVDNKMLMKAGLKRFSARATAAATGMAAPPSAGGDVAAAIHQLRSLGVRIEPGISEDEFERIEANLNIEFPAHLRCVLREGLPIGEGFPDWRSGGAAALRLWIDAPKSILLAAAERGDFWWKSWGSWSSGAAIARAALRRAPMLIPVYEQCYVAAGGGGGGGGVVVIFVDEEAAFYCAANVCDLFLKDSFANHVKSVNPQPYIPDSISIPGSVGIGNVDARRMIARCESNLGQSNRRKIDEGGGDEDVHGGILSHGWLCSSIGSSSSSSSIRTDDRKSSSSISRISRRSSCDDEVPRIDASFSSLDSGSSSSICSTSSSPSFSAASRSRRIDFWSDLVEKRHKLNIARDKNRQEEHEQDKEEVQDEFLNLVTMTTEYPKCTNSNSCESSLVEDFVQDMSRKLRNAGWNEAEIAEISSCSTKIKDHHPNRPAGDVLPDRQAVIHGLAMHLDALSLCLRDAGWSLHDVADTLCFHDMSGFSQQRQRPNRLHIPADVAARIGILAAFVAQG